MAGVDDVGSIVGFVRAVAFPNVLGGSKAP